MKKKLLLIFPLLFLVVPLFANNILPIFLILGIPVFAVGHILIIAIEFFIYLLVFKPERKIKLLIVVVVLNIVTTVIGAIMIFLFSFLGATGLSFFEYISGIGWEEMNWTYHYLAIGFDFIMMYFTTTFVEFLLFSRTKLAKKKEKRKVLKTVMLANLLSYIFLAFLYYSQFFLEVNLFDWIFELI